MSRRFQIILTDEQFAFLDAEADRSSVSISELVRRALDTTYSLIEPPALLTVINHSAGRRPGRRIDRPRWRSSGDYFSPSQ